MRHFSLLYAAGALACELNVLPFSTDRIHEAVQRAFQSWVSKRGGYGSFEEERALTAIREFIELHASRFQSESQFKSEYTNPLRERAGVQVKWDGHSYYAFLPGVWKNEVCQGQDARAVAKIALRHGFLEPENNALGKVANLQRKVTLDGCRVRAYWIKATILGEQASKQSGEATNQTDDNFESRVVNFWN